MPTTLTGNTPDRERRIQSLLLDRLVLRYERRVATEIRRAMFRAARSVEDGNPVPDASEHERQLRATLNTLWTDSARRFAEHILGKQQGRTGPESRKRAQVEPTQIMDGVMREWIATYGGRKITEITETTMQDINNQVSMGIRDGLSELDMARAIRDVARTKSASRAQTIARTETHAAANASSQASAEATGQQMERVWIAADGPRTRATHDAADGQRVGMNEAFNVGGFDLMYPGDPAGPAAEVINCRCAVIFEVME